jgi:hypothetical protein
MVGPAVLTRAAIYYPLCEAMDDVSIFMLLSSSREGKTAERDEYTSSVCQPRPPIAQPETRKVKSPLQPVSSHVMNQSNQSETSMHSSL